MRKLHAALLLIVLLPQSACFKDGEGHKIARTRTCLNQLELMISMEIAYESIPEGVFSSMLLHELIRPGVARTATCLQDGWGNWFKIYHNAEQNSFKIWSFGPNGIDNNGKEDDIVKFFRLQASQTPCRDFSCQPVQGG